MQHTTNYNLNKPEGGDLFAPLTQNNPNWDAIDAGMQANKVAAVFPATEVISAGVHAITRSVADASMFRFTAVGNYASGDSFTVDGVSVTAVTAKGETLTAGAWVTGAEVLACLKGTVLTLYVSAASTDAQTLEGHAASYFGTATAVAQAQGDAAAAGNVANAASVTANQALAIAQAAGMQMVKVWENSNISLNFAAQTVTLTGVPDNVKYFIVRFVINVQNTSYLGTSTVFESEDLDKYDIFGCNDPAGLTGGNVNASRTISIVGTTCKIGQGRASNQSDPKYAVPYQIYAVK